VKENSYPDAGLSLSVSIACIEGLKMKDIIESTVIILCGSLAIGLLTLILSITIEGLSMTYVKIKRGKR